MPTMLPRRSSARPWTAQSAAWLVALSVVFTSRSCFSTENGGREPIPAAATTTSAIRTQAPAAALVPPIVLAVQIPRTATKSALPEKPKPEVLPTKPEMPPPSVLVNQAGKIPAGTISGEKSPAAEFRILAPNASAAPAKQFPPDAAASARVALDPKKTPAPQLSEVRRTPGAAPNPAAMRSSQTTAKAPATMPAPQRVIAAQEPKSVPPAVAPTAQPPVAPLPTAATSNSQVNLAVKPLAAISLRIAPPAEGPIPGNMAEPIFAQAGTVDARFITDRAWLPWAYYWQATAFCHQPLYFEEPNLERYGHHAGCFQPLLSGAHFFGTIPLLPYKLALDHPCDCQYVLGYGRPGDCNAWAPHQCRWDPKAALVEGGVATGIIFVFP